MTFWRPPQLIKVKVLGLVWRGEQLLVAEVEDDSGRVKGVRPLGGTVEFGETRVAALQREFKEELGCGIQMDGPWHTFENIYEHEGLVGHEIVMSVNVKLGDEQFYAVDSFRFTEANQIRCRATWVLPLQLAQGLDLYPTGLLSHIHFQNFGRER